MPPPEALFTLLGVVLASLPQLTSKGRLRNRISFWTAQAQGTTLEYDHKVAESFRREATARLLALEAYPALRLLVPAYMIFVGPLASSSLGAAIGDSYPSFVTIEAINEQDPLLPGFALVIVPVIMATGLLALAQVIKHRRRAVDMYLHAEAFIRVPDPYSDSIGEEPSGAGAIKWLHLLGALAFSLGIYFTLALVFAALSADQFFLSAETSWPIFALAVGCLLTTAGAVGVYDLFKAEYREWAFPFPLEGEAARRRSVPAAEEVSPRLGAERTWWHFRAPWKN